MNKSKKDVLLGFTKERFPESCHVCLIYENEEERQKVVSAYLAAGIRQGEAVRYFSDVTAPETIRTWLLNLGVDLSAAEEKGAFSIFRADKGYCPDGHFEPQKMIDRSVQRYDEAKKAGYTGVRSSGELSWALKGIPGSERLMEYEVLLNTVDSTFPHTGMCQYDARLFDGATLFRVLQIHPYVIAQGQVVRNPFYMRPEEYLAELKSQKI